MSFKEKQLILRALSQTPVASCTQDGVANYLRIILVSSVPAAVKAASLFSTLSRRIMIINARYTCDTALFYRYTFLSITH